MKLIDLHKQWMKTGLLPKNNGLCCELMETKYIHDLELFAPTVDEEIEIIKNGLEETWWGSNMPRNSIGMFNNYTTTRQSIVLLICAMHNEI